MRCVVAHLASYALSCCTLLELVPPHVCLVSAIGSALTSSQTTSLSFSLSTSPTKHILSPRRTYKPNGTSSTPSSALNILSIELARMILPTESEPLSVPTMTRPSCVRTSTCWSWYCCRADIVDARKSRRLWRQDLAKLAYGSMSSGHSYSRVEVPLKEWACRGRPGLRELRRVSLAGHGLCGELLKGVDSLDRRSSLEEACRPLTKLLLECRCRSARDDCESFAELSDKSDGVGCLKINFLYRERSDVYGDTTR